MVTDTPGAQTSASPEQAAGTPLGWTVALHLIPGGLATLAFAALAPAVASTGYPPALGFLVAAAVVIVPFELGYLRWRARRQHGRRGMAAVVAYREPARWWHFVVVTAGLLVWAVLVSGILGPPEAALGRTLFGWLPDWLVIAGPDALTGFGRPALVVTFVVGLVVNGIAAPIVEELYFRGHLLPRLSRLGRWAPLVNTVLFSLYHFWAPWQLVSRIVLILPLAYAVWWRRNVWLAVAAHCLVNLVGWSLTFALVLRT